MAEFIEFFCRAFVCTAMFIGMCVAIGWLADLRHDVTWRKSDVERLKSKIEKP